MAIVSLFIPQIGEGLQEARIVGFLKQPGERVRRDEPIYQMETDKAVMDVESPYDGVLVEWTAAVDSVVPIGAEVGRLESGAVAESSAAPVHAPTPVAPTPAGPTPAAPASSDAESLVALRIPQIGEGLQEARVVALLKQPGEAVKRDEPIYQMETDKAVMDVESPHEGILDRWVAAADQVLPIGAEVAFLKVAGSVPDSVPAHGAPAPVAAAAVAAPAAPSVPAISVPKGPLRNAQISPRARAYARDKGLTEDDLHVLATKHGRIHAEHIDDFLSGAGQAPYVEQLLGQKQRLLASRLSRGSQLVVPGTISVATLWEGIERLRARYKARGGDFQPSGFTMFAYCVSRALRDYPMFRSTLRGDDTLRTYRHANLGIAVALPGDQLVLAVVEEADTLDWERFARRTREKIELARAGHDQANESVTLSLTNMQSFGLRDAVPVVVPPAVGTLFLGEIYQGLDQHIDAIRLRRYANLALTFDHRLINGVGGAEFINAVKKNIEQIEELIPLK